MPNEKNDRFKQIKDRIEQLLKDMAAETQKQFTLIAQELFEQFPEMNSFSWAQYTPYFNDGDECIFGVSSDADINNIANEDISKAWSYGGKHYEAHNPELLPAKKAVQDFLDTVPDGMMKDIFGDHVKVTLYRDGTVEKDEYEHD